MEVEKEESQTNSPREELQTIYEIEKQVLRHLKTKDLFERLLEDKSSSNSEQMECQEEIIKDECSHGSHQPCDKASVCSNEDHPGCKCTKIDCLKLYCECFSKGRLCNSKCICTCCHNQKENKNEIYEAKRVANYRNPGFFSGIPAYVPVRKCTCKKSFCRKRYCECFNAGLKCTQDCQCFNCHNGRPCSIDHYQKMLPEIKVQA